MRKLDIEPLSEQRWSRIERELFDRVSGGEVDTEAIPERVQTPPRWRMAAALVLAGAGAAVGGGFAWHVITSPSRGGVVLVAPSRIATDQAGSHVSIGEATLEVAPRSTVAVSGDDARGVTVVLEQGRVECEVPPRHGRPPFAVEAGEVVVRVVGTHFAVTRNASQVDVEVQRGVVEVADGAERVDVGAGETWPPRGVATPAVSTASASGAANPISPVSPASQAAPATVPSAREVYESASRLEASRPDTALATYRDLASKGGPWGMNALFAAGRLEADRGRRDEARTLLRDYLARYPAGPNANDARQLLDRLR